MAAKLINKSKEAVLVVGGAGYIGSHMVKTLVDQNYRVIILDNLSTGFRQLTSGCELIEGRLGDRDLLNTIFQNNGIGTVMHFAAFSLVGESVLAPLKYYQNNISETIALVETMIRNNVRRFIFSSTAAVYGEPMETPIVETHPCQPTNPYGVTKMCVERLLADCDAAHGLKSICLRYFNAAGADLSGKIGEMHDPESHLIPIILKNTLAGKPVKIYGTDYPTDDGTCIRDYIHVSDLARAHLLALEALADGYESTVFNLGNSVGFSVREVIHLAGKVTEKKIVVVEEDRRPGDPAVLIADSGKIRRELGWRPEYESLETIIESAWRWHSKP